MANNDNPKSNKFLAIAAVIGVCVVVALFAASMWQESTSQSKIDEAQSNLLTASLIGEAQADGTAAGGLLNEYVVSGDETLIPQVQASTATAVQKLSAAIAEAGADEGNFLAQGSSAVEALAGIIALRQVGEVAAAGAALEELSPGFNQLLADLDAYADSERAAAVTATASAEDANTMASWLALVAGVLAAIIVLAAVVIVIGNLRRRSTVGAPSTS